MSETETIARLQRKLAETERVLIDFYAAATHVAPSDIREKMIEATQGLASWWNDYTTSHSWKQANCRVTIRIAEIAIARATEAKNEAARNLQELTK